MTKNNAWVKHVTRLGQAMGLRIRLYDPITGGIMYVSGNKHVTVFESAAILNYDACFQEIEEE